MVVLASVYYTIENDEKSNRKKVEKNSPSYIINNRYFRAISFVTLLLSILSTPYYGFHQLTMDITNSTFVVSSQ